ncbi:hyoscyamine 6-dioxygenase [Capsicum annuum]|uniref:hyoscyamine 6-dioxygenase n=1 Tax=Capsicum annuum TaxID=4072 RepID=UPI001FB05341|nr:hyoscyamine 6-dioxygenase [Capsicum annuum]
MASLISSWASQVNTVPERYVVPSEKRLNINVPIGKDIPVIDFSLPSEKIVEDIIKASQEYGVFQVINHGVSQELIADVLKVCEEFYKLPMEELEKYTEEEEELSEFEPNLDQKPKLFIENEYRPKKNGKNDKEVIFWKDTFAHCTHPTTEDRISSWPEKPEKYREVIGKYSEGVRKTSLKVLELMCEGLGLEKDHFAYELSQIQYLLINLYPKCPDPTVTAGAVEHTDGGVINMLLQELGGLHVRRQKDGQWFAVEPIPGALVCINGMLLKVISNGKLESGIHRVATNSVRDRISVGCLTSPACNGECIIEPARALLSETNPPKYKPFSCTEYLKIFFTDTSEFEAALNPYKL